MLRPRCIQQLRSSTTADRTHLKKLIRLRRPASQRRSSPRCNPTMANGTKVYRAREGVVVEYDSSFLKLETSWDSFATCDDLPSYLAEAINAARNLGDSKL